MKVSLITVCHNSAKTIQTTIDSVFMQRGVDVEYIVGDGSSTDGTVDIISRCSERAVGLGCHANVTFKWFSASDRGMYDALNRGLVLATGDVVGILNSDDVLASDDTLAKIAEAFEPPNAPNQEDVDCVYADVRFVKGGDTVDAMRRAKTVRYCSAAWWRPWMFRFAAMAPHPSFYVRREWFERLGDYSLDYRISADFELELRYLWLAKLRSRYIPECVVIMRMGGMSTAGWRSNVAINKEDLRALRMHGIWSCLPLISLKYIFKIWGFVFRRNGRSALRA